MKKLDLPVFEGQNPDGWILRAERYFSFYRLGEDEKLEAAVVSLDGDALLWYQWEHQRRPALGGIKRHVVETVSAVVSRDIV